MAPFRQPVLARDTVRYVGEPVAAVVARDRYLAEDALEFIDVEFDALEGVTNPERALEDQAPKLFGTSNVVDVTRYLVGEPDAVMRAPRLISGRYRIERDAGTPIETRGVVAEWDPGRDSLTVHTSTQVPHIVRDVLVSILGLPPSSIRVVAPDVGGGFGAKLQLYPEDLIVSILAQRLRRPVKWIEDRWEHFVATTHGREQLIDIEVGYDDDGILLALRLSILTNTGAYAQAFSRSEPSLAAMLGRGAYRIQSFEATSTMVVTNKTPMNPYRGVGMVQPLVALERTIDLIAGELNLDPAEVRLRNMVTPEEMPYSLGVGNALNGEFVYDSGDYPQALRKALELVEYDKLRSEQARLRSQGRYVGIGIAPYVEVTTVGPYESSTVRIDSSGRVVVHTGAGPSGQGTQTVLAQVVADELGVPIEDVMVVHGDTELVRYGLGSWSSRIAALGGTSAAQASARLKSKILAAAATMLEVGEEDLEIENSRVGVVGAPEKSFTLAEIAQALAPGRPLPEGIDSYGLEATESFHPTTNAFSYGTVIAVVEVDIDTCTVHPLRLVMVGDSGTIINPVLVDGQYQGGLAMGLGEALLERIVYDEGGQPLNPNMLDYRIPQVDNIPEILLGHTEIPTPHNPLGIKGAGESGAIAPPAAFANAVSDALGPFKAHVSEIPILPERLYRLLHAARIPEEDKEAEQDASKT
jgi:carbon-monoxide dehydrogenase large subunit